MANSNNMIKHVAPTLASALQSDLSPLATKYIADHADPDGETTALNFDNVLESLVQTPEGLKQLKTIEQAFRIDMKSLSIDVQSIDAAGAGESASSNVLRDNRPQVLISVVFILIYFALLGALLAIEASDTVNMQAGDNSLLGEIQILLGVLTAGIGQILNYWFGGAFGSRRRKEEGQSAS